ncbi:MAG: hypothetical protein IT555_13115 [Acetobacteraceae bacterium]|nr:hypothetical protein [Acetobacteraceae bacterium]
MTRLVPIAAGLALAFAAMTPALAREEGTFQPSVVASQASGPAAPGVQAFGPNDDQYNDGTHIAQRPPAAPAMQAPGVAHFPSGTMYNDGTQSGL